VTASLDIYGDLKPNYGLKINAANCEVTSVSENPGRRQHRIL
jgi:hypothetical protein